MLILTRAAASAKTEAAAFFGAVQPIAGLDLPATAPFRDCR